MTVIDSRAEIIGAVSPAPPYIERRPDGKRTAYQQVAAVKISDAAINAIVARVTENVTRNVVVNLVARLKDRCAHESQTRKGACGIARAAHHVNDHDFIEKPAPAPEAKP